MNPDERQKFSSKRLITLKLISNFSKKNKHKAQGCNIEKVLIAFGHHLDANRSHLEIYRAFFQRLTRH